MTLLRILEIVLCSVHRIKFIALELEFDKTNKVNTSDVPKEKGSGAQKIDLTRDFT